ncbi:hypothetical protein GE21DRAFT_1117892 [Neurospora crassa]|nr:hypothetical protein GE21DRAFT_1117892 [Neurospora crassa]
MDAGLTRFFCGRRLFRQKTKKHIFVAYLYHTIPLSEEGTGFCTHIIFWGKLELSLGFILLCCVCCFKMNMYMLCSV